MDAFGVKKTHMILNIVHCRKFQHYSSYDKALIAEPYPTSA